MKKLRGDALLSFCMYFLFGITLPLFPQNNMDWMDYIEQLTDDEEISDEEVASLIEELSYLAENPFNIQTVRKKDLERLPFLSDVQIENLLYYTYKYAPIADLYELRNVQDLDRSTIRYLLPFLYVGEPERTGAKITPQSLWKQSKQELLLRTNFTVQEKAGYRDVTDEEKEASPNKFYRGEPYYLSTRYNYNYRDKVLFGLAAEKDPGETFLRPSVEGFDHYAFNLSIKDLKFIEMLSLGDYRLSFGQGLVLNNNFSMGKTSDIASVNQRTQGIRRHTSMNEVDYFRGVAIAGKLGNIKATLFYSRRKPDANVDGYRIKSFVNTGYHRTPSETNKRHAAEVDLAGMDITWRYDRLQFGATVVYYSFGGKELNPEPREYNRYYLRGKDHFNLGLNYAYSYRKCMLRGEVAIDGNNKPAMIGNLGFRPTSTLDLLLSIRHYDKAYNALYGKSFGESNGVRNESGIYLGAKLRPLPYWEIAAYWDNFRFPYQKYGIGAPSSGNDFQLQLNHFPNRKLLFGLRYRHKRKSKDIRIDENLEPYVLPYNQDRWRFQIDYQCSRLVKLKTQLHHNSYTDAKQESNGWSLSQMVSLTPSGGKLTFDASCAYFNVPDWNNRINIYERNVLYAASFPVYYGCGWRTYINLKYRINESFALYLKAADSYYPNRESIGSGLEEIVGKHKTDLYMLLKYKF